MRLFQFSVFLFIMTVCLASSQQGNNTESDIIFDVLNMFDTIPEPADTVSDFVIVYGDYEGKGRNKMSSDIMNVVRTFYAPKNQDIDKTQSVLDYLENAYSEHDYHESGSWVKDYPNYRRYFPYQGELPTFTSKDFVNPISGKITSGYGYRVNRHRNHYGIDIAINIGDTIKCALPGVVTRIGYERGGYGNYVVVAHYGDMETIYAHLNSAIANPGQKILSGEAIGLGGSTGNSTGPHLHFETRLKGMPINPFTWFNLYFDRGVESSE
ncbi:MAG: M23 family metallopeptidase [Muribaculaceae bacterium]|nr:M23 family metallopeptidase [Muribaculaceae bacterium]